MTQRRRIQARDLLQRLGNVDPSTLRRWYTKGAPGFCGFPQPHFLGVRRLWWLDEIETWERAHEKPAPTTCNLAHVPVGPVTP